MSKKKNFCKCLFTIMLVFIPVLIASKFAEATVLDDWPYWKDNKRTLRVYIDDRYLHPDEVREAMDTWNNANAGRNNWRFVETANPGEAEIIVNEENLKPKTGAVSMYHYIYGGFLQMGRRITWVKIKVNSLNNTRCNRVQRIQVIVHEIGHCMRMDHTKNPNDIMHRKLNLARGNYVPTPHDLEEAKASDEDPPCPFAPTESIVREANSKIITLIPKPGANINLEDIETVSIESKTGPDLYTHVSGWNKHGIDVEFYAKQSASYNEVFGVTLKYPGNSSSPGYSEEYTGVLTVTEKSAPKNSFPHSVAGHDITVSESEPVVLDGSQSYHDDSSVFFTSHWLIKGEGNTGYGLCASSGELTLPPGTYNATLYVKDYYTRKSEDSITITVEPIGTPEISVNRSNLYYAAIKSGEGTSSKTCCQDLLISNSGSGTLNWKAGNDASWLTCNPTSGTGSGVITVSVKPCGLAVGSYSGAITISDANASNSPQTVVVDLTVMNPSQDQPPFGTFVTPEEGSTIRGSVALTGWVLDDVDVESVKIYNGSNYIGEAVFVEGARPDVEQSYPGYPKNYQAGWGYMLLTYFLPNGGNGTYTLYAKATDSAGQQVTLGSKTVTVDNVNAVKPFGAIDTPHQGGTASGSNFRNNGWVLTPQPTSIPTDGSTIKVYVDGVELGHPTYNIYRSDIANLFPGYSNSNGAAGYYILDTTAYENGVHSIYWTATDDAGNTDGIGSRYFKIQNSGGNRARGTADAGSTGDGGQWTEDRRPFAQIPVDNSDPVGVIKGYKTNVEPQKMYPGDNGYITMEINELERLELHLTFDNQHLTMKNAFSGYHVIGNQLKPLPIGSTLDKEKGVFHWQPGPGFVGEYRFMFFEKHQDGEMNRKDIKVTIGPKGE
jgi:hypothetical protein